MKKTLIFFIVPAIVVFALCACTAKQNAADSETGAAGTAPAQTTVAVGESTADTEQEVAVSESVKQTEAPSSEPGSAQIADKGADSTNTEVASTDAPVTESVDLPPVDSDSNMGEWMP